jgi:endo-1,4-beta-xylanase
MINERNTLFIIPSLDLERIPLMGVNPPSGLSRGLGRRSLLVGTAATAMVALTKPGPALADATITTNQTGWDNGYFYSFWTNDPGSTTMWLKSGGRFDVSWTDSDNCVVGKGWGTGSWRTVNYWGSYYPNGSSFLALYGWTRNPLVEYYIIDNWGGNRPGPGTWKGTVDANNGLYDVYEDTRYNAPSVEGDNKTFKQFFSVRRSQRTGGAITTNDHFAAWSRLGMNLGSLDYYMIMAVEGLGSSGYADITVS